MPVPDESQASVLNKLDDEVATSEKTLKEATAQLAERMPFWERSAREVAWEPLEIVALCSAGGTVLQRGRRRDRYKLTRRAEPGHIYDLDSNGRQEHHRFARGSVERSVVAQRRAGIVGQRQLRPHRNQTRRRERVARRASGSGDFEKSGRRSLASRLPDPAPLSTAKKRRAGPSCPLSAKTTRPFSNSTNHLEAMARRSWRSRSIFNRSTHSISSASSDSRFQPGPIPPIVGFRRKFARHSPRPAISARPIKITSSMNSSKRLRLGCVRFATTSPRSRRTRRLRQRLAQGLDQRVGHSSHDANPAARQLARRNRRSRRA